MIDIVTTISLWELIKHTGSWLTNLRRAKEARKQESVAALRKVLIAARKTSVYLRQLNDTGKRCHQTESDIALLWTELGFALDDLGITRLATRCKIKGKQWADPAGYDQTLLEKTDLGLERMEQLANRLLHELER